ncbi:MAG: hypothetical protein LBH95_05820, partial [Oscillospiraceae bacterium]|nr:hypothetical protein [Oscillospiraceae bacterium]
MNYFVPDGGALIPPQGVGGNVTLTIDGNAEIASNVYGGAVRVHYAQSGGTVTLTLTNSKIAEILDTSHDGEAVFDLTGVRNAEAAVLSADAVKAFGGANVAVTFIFPNATVTLGPDALATLATQAGRQAVTVEASVVPPEDLTKMQAAQVRGYGAVVN